jgi:hypothetical protein
MSKLKCVVCDIEIERPKNKFCSTSCTNKYKYQNNKTKLNANTYIRQIEKYRYRKFKLIELRGNTGCEKCGYIKNLGALDFHHIDSANKSFTLDSRKLSNKSWESIINEFEKCIILCANCHREYHNPELNIIDRNLYNEIPEIEKSIYKCVDCNTDVYSKDSKRCISCSNKARQKVDRPDLEILLKEISENGYSATGRKYGVSDNTIRKWIKNK